MSDEGASSEPEQNTTGEDRPARPGMPSSSSHGLTSFLSQRLRYNLRSLSRSVFIDPKFSRNSRRYFLQGGLATLAMLVLLLFFDSLSQAALAAGLGSSVITVFVNPSNRTASTRSVVGGHSLALLLGSAFSVLLFAAPVETFLDDLSVVRNLSLAVSVGLLILAMAITDTEHAPAAGTVLGHGHQAVGGRHNRYYHRCRPDAGSNKIPAPFPFAGPYVVIRLWIGPHFPNGQAPEFESRPIRLRWTGR